MEMISHEAKTPITGLKLQLEHLQHELGPSSNYSDQLDNALLEVRRLSSMLDKSINLYRIESQAMRKKSLHFADLIEEAIQRMNPIFRLKHVELKKHLDYETKVNGDWDCLLSMILTVLENSVVHNPSQEKIVTISMLHQSKNLTVQIWDNGPEIEEQEAKQIFKKFYRSANSRRVPGTGLGLFIAQSVANAHGGSIQYHKQRGFEIYLPRETT